ncbi:hypothetical protein [Desmospora activa]|uniref:DUF3558 domain-containing protein n=1 Tax=Desmospora activa DSM 45169 TaxID=1121389 RepID=A0A2T4Z0H0_9BACL|nr:hypothetical protein [Desmospora activa]PTM53236.1 hypothetical protein C8J48_3547 [Desmospora activa DSM 45169]
MKLPTFLFMRIGSVAVLAVLMILAGCSLPDLGTSSSESVNQSDSNSDSDSSQPPEQITGVLLKQQEGKGNPQRYGSVSVYDACTVLPLKALTDLGLEHGDQTDFKARSAVRSIHLAESVPAAVTGVGVLDGVSKCTYSIEGEHISLDIYQPPFNAENVLQRQLEVPTNQGGQFRTEQGVPLAVWQGPSGWYFVIDKQDVVVQGYLPLEKPNYGNYNLEQLTEEIAKQVIANLNQGPTAPAQYQYDSPYQGIPAPCKVVSAEAFEQSFGEPASGQIEATYYAGEFQTTNFGITSVPNITTECNRSNLVPSGNSNRAYRSVDVKFSHYRDEKWAKSDFKICNPDAPNSDLHQAKVLDIEIGDSPVCLTKSNETHNLFNFRVGKTIVQMETWREDPDNSDPQKLAQKLEPMAKAIAENLK